MNFYTVLFLIILLLIIISAIRSAILHPHCSCGTCSSCGANCKCKKN